MNSKKLTVTTYLVLARLARGWGNKARIIRHSANPPTLARGECAVKISIAVPSEAFDPVFFNPGVIDVDLGAVLRSDAATVTGEKP